MTRANKYAPHESLSGNYGPAPGTAIGGPRARQMTRGSDMQADPNEFEVMNIDGVNLRQDQLDSVTPVPTTPQTLSEFRFRAKKPNNRKLVPSTNRNLPH